MTDIERKSLIAEGAQLAHRLSVDSVILVPVDLEIIANRLMIIFGDLFIDEEE